MTIQNTAGRIKLEVLTTDELSEADFWNVPDHKSPVRYKPNTRPWLLPLYVSAAWFLNGIVVTYLFFLLTAN